MASEFLKRKAEERAAIIDKEFGKGAYGGTDDLNQKREAAASSAPKRSGFDTTSGWSDFNTETKNAYTTAKNKARNKTTIKSNLSDKERKARIKEIEDELKTISYQKQGYGRAGSYGGQANKDWLANKSKELDARKEELTAELKSLKRVGTYTASELKQFEIEDAKARKASLPNYNPTARIMPHQAEAFKANVTAHSEADKKIDTLKRQKELYDDITDFSKVVHTENGDFFHDFDSQWRANYRLGDLSREADKAMTEYIKNPTEENKQIAYAYDALAKEYAKNNAKALDEEGTKWSWLSKSFAGYLPQLRDQIVPELVGGGIGTLFGSMVGAPTVGGAIGAGLAVFPQSYDAIQGSVYRELLAAGVDEKTALEAAQDEALVSSLIESGETAASWAISGSGKALKAIGAAAKTSVAKGSTNAATKFVASMAGKATNRAAKKAAKAVTRPLWNKALRVGGRVFVNGATEYAEEFTQGAVSVANREQAYATVDNEIGQYGAGNVDLHNRPTYKNADGSISTVDSVLYQIDDKFVLLPTIARDENGKAIRLETDEEILAHFRDTGEFLGEFDTQEEADAYATKLHTAQAYRYGKQIGVTADDNLWSGGAKVVKSAVSGDNPELFGELHEQGKTGFTIGVMMGGTSTAVNTIITNYANAKTVKNQNEIADTIIEDEESLTALIEEGKASGAGTVSEDIATEIETAKANGKEITREQVKSLIEANKVYIAEENRVAEKTAQPESTAREGVAEREYNTPIQDGTPSQIAETKSINNEPISVEEAQKASGYGTSGSKLLAEVVNTTPDKSFSEIEGKTHSAYMAGRSNRVMHFDDPLKQEAYIAGQKDRIMEDAIKAKNAKNVVVNKESGFYAKNLPSDVTKTQAKIVDVLFKSVGVKGNIKTGLKGNAEIDRTTGEVFIDADFQRESGGRNVSIVFHAAHEAAMHRVVELAPEEGSALVYEMYKHFAGNEFSKFTLARQKRNAYAAQDVNISLATAMEEVSANKILVLYNNDEAKFHKAIKSIANGTNLQAKQGLRKYIECLTDFIRKLGEIIVDKKTKEERAQIQAELNEIRRLRDMFESAFAKGVENKKSLETKSDTKSAKNLEIKTNEEYNGNKSHSLYDEYNSIGMQWAYHSETKVGDRKVIYNSHTDEFVLVEATKDGVGFIELRTVDYEQIREDEEIYESKKQRVVDRKVYRTETGQNNNARDNGDAENGRTGKQNAELSEGKSRSNRTADTKTSDGDLTHNPEFVEGEFSATTDEGLNGSTKYSLKVKNQKTIAFLENQEHITTYKAMQLIDGKLYPPMAAKTKGADGKYHLANASKLGAWQRAVEDPSNIKFNDKGVGYYVLNKGDGSSVTAAYNPYEHSSNLVLNDQFEGAYKRDNLVTVECVIPKSEMTSGYKARHAKDSTGVLDWKSGVVASKIKDNKRMVYLSRWLKPVRIMDDAEVAKLYKDALGNSNVAVPFNVVTPSLLAELEKIGVSIDYEGSPLYKSNQERKKTKSKTSYSLKDSEGNTLTEAQQEYFKDSKVRDENGNLLVMYQGAREDFTVFDRKKSSYANLYGRGFYFTKSENHASQYGKTRAYYLNITNPVSTTETTITKSQLRKFLQAVIDNEDYSFENYGYDATVDSVLQSTYGKSDFLMLNDVSQTAIGDLVEAVELFNKINGTDYDGIILNTETVTFNSEQAKLTTNEKPTSNPDTRFSLKESVEETKNLIAVHNLWEEKLLKSLKLGGLPMPSIAIVRAREGHSNFGNISLVFYKDTISPTDRRNKVYSGDAWTPTYPHIEYKLNTKAQETIEKRINTLVPRDIQRDLGGLYLDESNMQDQLNRQGDLASSYSYNFAMKYAFLRDTGIEIDLPMKNASLSSGGKRSDEAIIKVAESVPEEVLRNAINGNDRYESEPAIRKAVAEAIQEKYKDKPVVANALMPKEELSLGQLMGYAGDALRYKEEGIRQEVDFKEASNLIDEKTDTAKYEKWLKELFSDVIAKEGIRNDKDLFTPSGNRRSFEALHYEHTLENVIKAMKEKGEIGIGGFGGNNIMGASVVEYGSIEQIKEKASERMKSLPEEEYDKIRTSYTDRFYELANSLSIHKDSFSALDDAANMLCEAVMKYKTKSGMANYLRNECKGWANYSDYVVDDLVELVNDIRNMPTSYFEAKPQRAVGFNEIAMAIIPDNSSEELKTLLAENGVTFKEYEHGDNDARLEALNSLEDVQFSLKNTDINTKDRKQLLDTIESLKNEFKLTEFAKADPKRLTKMTKDILKEYSSQADFDETFKDIDVLYQYMANGEDGHPAVWEDVYNRAYDISQEIVKNALVVDDYYYNEYKHLRNYLRTTPIKFYKGYDGLPTSYENFNDFRKSNFGRLKFTKDGMAIDSMYQELAGLYPEFFNADEQITIEEQLDTILNVLDEIQPKEVNPYSRELQEASAYLANDIISRFYDIPQAKPTFADKAERRVIQANIKGAKKVEAVRQQRDEKVKKAVETQKAKAKEQIDKLRQQRDEKVKKEQQKRRDAISKMNETQKAKVYRARIERHASDLSKKLVNPTDNQHIPYELQGAVAKLLECINLESNYSYDVESGSYKKNDEGLPTKRTQAYNDLKKVYADIASSVVVDPDLMGEDGLLSGVISLADKRIADMTSSELETVWQSIRAIEASVSTANKLFSQGKFATIVDVADTLRKENVGKKEKTELKGLIGKGKKLATLDMLTPETYLHYLGNAGDSIFRMLRDAQDKHISIMKEVADFTHKALKDVDVNSLEKTIHTVKLGGEDVQLSTAQIMELYVLMKREQAKEHILVGGILPDTIEGKGLKKITKAKPARNITIAEISATLSKLTSEQKNIADKLQKYVSTVLSAYGNEASMQVYNYEKFNEKNYWTIRTNRQEINSDVEKDTAVTTVANKGMTKATKPHANTSVRIGSIFDTFASHSSDMATYAAWLGTSEDVNRIRNFVFWEEGARTGTVKDILDAVHGTQGSQYLEKLLADIAIGVKGTDNMNPFDKFIGHYKAASVGANLRVVIQQPTALLRALDMIDARYLTEGAVRPLKGWEKAKKYAPIAQWKDWGHFDINTGRQMKDVLFDNANLLEKTKQAGMWGASMADSLAWGQLWNAVEAETKARHTELEVGSIAYYETVAKRFTEIVDHTQVVDGILQRSQIMRSPDALTKMATSFMGEPTKQYNMAMSAAYDTKTTKGDARKKAVSRLGRTALSLAVAGIINACAQSIIDAMRDDDKEKKYWERWLTAFVGDGEDTKWYDTNLADTVNPLNYVPFAKDIVSILRGYDVKRMDTEAITKVLDATKNMYKSISGEGKYTIAESSAQLFAEIARMYGVPVANVKRDVKSLVMAIAIETDSYLMQYRMEKAMLDINYAGNSKNFMDILFNAYNNDREAYEEIYYDMLESGYDADKIQSGMETRLKKAEGVKEASELSKRYMTPTTERKYNSSFTQIQSSEVWQSATPEQRKDAKADLYSFLTSDSEDMKKTRAEAEAAGVDETEYTLWKLAIEMADQPEGEKGSGSYDFKEKAKAINSLDLGNEEIAYFFGKGLNEWAKQELTKVQSDGIDLQAYVNFKAATSDMTADKDASGKSIPNSKKRKIVNYLNSADITDEEWKYFYYEIMEYKR